jgi:hypothetical protein
MMEAEKASETLDCSSILTRLVAREDFILNIDWLAGEHTHNPTGTFWFKTV